MKNLTELAGNWKLKKGLLKQKIGMFADNDSLLIKGKQDEILGRMQVHLGKTKAEIHKIISKL